MSEGNGNQNEIKLPMSLKLLYKILMDFHFHYSLRLAMYYENLNGSAAAASIQEMSLGCTNFNQMSFSIHQNRYAFTFCSPGSLSEILSNDIPSKHLIEIKRCESKRCAFFIDSDTNCDHLDSDSV